MATWILVPCLGQLRGEFNTVAPNRDRGADGSIGDSSHTSSSDHADDEASDVLRDRDADSDHEVHATDIDSTGPWPDGKGGEAGGWFDQQIRRLAEQERVEYESPDVYGRLQNIIWRGRIISRSWGWSEWRPYSGPSAHFDHAHFSARYLTGAESDTRPWGIEEDDMPSAEDIARAVWAYGLQDPYAPTDPSRKLPAGTWLKYSTSRGQVSELARAVAALASADVVDEAAIGAVVLAALTPEAIAAAIPAELAEQVADKLAERLQA
ncbi:hypothetical protein FHR83_007007 [Actinoplanes campanulatus]|uniref:Uncharacterized protein n=1 Tax=Actinoplanes campanulatus TaxID=113559 RepID=A0A7W5AN24_9ACTN|nr:hypothetical protein [Actinoplanes campanulatus]MBB3099301.1 hypothetical protein [Actinoplanes campanulatus]GGN40568.1 hypothetical protein GCM10010109_69840 [Actinoplanes campanulatus]GID40619.1 hypothetical protein Aca09nite_71250 [Actinoplanes campanulatus]